MLDNPGSVEDGNNGVSGLLALPTWKGELPKGVKRVIRGDSEFLGTLTRTQLLEPKDFPNVQKIQHQYKLQPLSAYLGKPAAKLAPGMFQPGDLTIAAVDDRGHLRQHAPP